MATLLLKDVLIIFALSIPVVLLLRKLHLPSLLGFVLTGALIGPHGFGLIADKEQIDILAELGVTLLLFVVGLKFSWKGFHQFKNQSLMAASLQVILTTLAGFSLGLLLGWPYYRSIYFGCLMTLSSTAVVLTLLQERKRLDSLAGRISTAILIIQDLALIPMMVLLPYAGQIFQHQSLVKQLLYPTLAALGLMAATLVFVKFLATPLLKIISKALSRELFVITVITMALGFAWLTDHLSLSYALGAFLAGLIIGSTEYQFQALAEIQPFQFCFNSLFFVSIGMLLNFDFLSENLKLVFLLLIAIFLIKALVTTLAVHWSRFPLTASLNIGISLAQIGEFSFLLAYLGAKAGTLSEFFYQLMVAIAVLSMILTPLMVVYAPKLASLIASLPVLRRLKIKEESREILTNSQALHAHVIICGFGPLGQTLGKILAEHQIKYLVLELNPQTIHRLRQENTHAFYGDGASEDLLFESGIERAALLAITVPGLLDSAAIIHKAKFLNPRIPILARAKYRSDMEILYEAGADIVISEEVEGGIEMGRYALKALQVDEAEVKAFLYKAREFGSKEFF